MEQKVSMESVVLPSEKKEQINFSISQLKYNKLIFEDWGFGDIFEKGTAVSMIFYGIPGTGKTLMAQAIAQHLGQNLLPVSPAEIETNMPGGTERNIKKFFKIASGKIGLPTDKMDKEGNQIVEKPQKYVLFFDECDSLIHHRNSVGMIIAGQINTLLSELESFDGVVIFTTNRIGVLDPALERRITAKIEFEFPGQEIRRKIWDRMIPKKAPISQDVNFDELSEFPLTGGNIKNIVLNAARKAAYGMKKSIDRNCFLDAIENEVMASKKFSDSFKEFKSRNYAVEEAGSATEGKKAIIEKVEKKEAVKK